MTGVAYGAGPYGAGPYGGAFPGLRLDFPALAVECAFPHDPGSVQNAYRQEVLKDLPRGYWRFQEASPGVGSAADLSQYTVPGTYQASPTLTLGGPLTGDAAAKYLTLNGTTQYVSTPATLPVGAWTLEAWYLTTSAGTTNDMLDNNSGNTGATAGLILRVESGKLKIYMWDTTIANWRTVVDTVNTNDGLWHHGLAVWDGAVIHLYRDGTEAANSGSITVTQNNYATWPFHVGHSPGVTTEFFSGSLAEPAIYPLALTAARAAAHYAARTNPNPDASLAGLPWRNITRSVISVAPQSGRQKEIDRVELGSCAFSARNNKRQFEPEYQGDPGNMLYNPTFKIDVTTRVGYDTSLSALTRQTSGGVDNLEFAQGAAAAAAAYLYDPTGFAVVPGNTYTILAWIKRNTRAGTVTLKAQFWDTSALGTNVATPTFTSPSLAAGAWTLVKFAVVAPAGGNWLRPFFQFDGNTVGDVICWDHLAVRLGDWTAGATLSDPLGGYVDGDFDNARWTGARHLSPTQWGGPYYPYVVPNRRLRCRAAWPPQMVPNGSFRRSGSLIAPWASVGTVAIAAVTALTNPIGVAPGTTTGGYATALKMTATGLGTDQAYVDSDFIPVDPSKVYSLSMYFLKAANLATMASIQMLCYDDSRSNLLGTVYAITAPPGALIGQSGFDLAYNVWRKYGGVFGGEYGSNAVVPSGGFMPGTKYVKLRIIGINNPAGASYSGDVFLTGVALTPHALGFPDADYYTSGDWDANDAWNEVFNGYVGTWSPSWPSAKRGEVEIPCNDGTVILSARPITSIFPSHLSGTRLAFVLDAVGWPRSERALAPGQSQVVGVSFASGGQSAPQHVGDVVYDTEAGVQFFDPSGQCRYYDRSDRVTGGGHAASLATFGDGGPASGELGYLTVSPLYSSEMLYNKVVVTRSGAVTGQTAEDSASQSSYGTKELDVASQHVSDSDANTYAQVMLGRYKQPHQRFDTMTLDPRRDRSLWAQVVKRKISDRVTVLRRPYGTVTPLNSQVHIDGIRHEIYNNGRSWIATYGLTPADTQTYWIMDTSQLDVNTRISF